MTRAVAAAAIVIAACGGDAELLATLRVDEPVADVPIDPVAVAEPGDPRCSDADDCYKLARQGGEVDLAMIDKAIRLYRESCDSGVLRSCERALVVMSQHRRGADPVGEVALQKAACELGKPINCTRAAELIADSDHEGSLALRWKAITTTAERCVDTPEGCARLGIHQSAFSLARIDPVRVAELVKPACDSGDPRGCEVLARTADIRCHEGCEAAVRGAGKRARARALELYSRRCETDEYACVSLGFLHWWGIGGVPSDPARAVASLKRACDRRAGYACVRMADYLFRGHPKGTSRPRAADGLALYRKLCDAAATKLDQQSACRALRRIYKRGEGAPADPVKAQTYARKACELGSRNDCQLIKE